MTSLQKKDQSSFGAPEKKERKRIQPQLILSPTKSAAENDAVAARAKQALADLGDLKEQSEIAANLLGPGRKIYVDLPSYQREEKFVDWKEVRFVCRTIFFVLPLNIFSSVFVIFPLSSLFFPSYSYSSYSLSRSRTTHFLSL